MRRIVKVIRKGIEDDNKENDILNQISRIYQEASVNKYLLEKKLENLPDGFPLGKDDARSCKICDETVWGENSWYDKFGAKCISCQEAINNDVIPVDLTKDDFYTLFELENYFCISQKKARQWIKQAIVKSKTIVGKGRKSNLIVFLLGDNERFFPPKGMLEGKMVYLEPENEEPYHTFLPWYHYCNVLEYLKDYRIVKYLGYN